MIPLFTWWHEYTDGRTIVSTIEFGPAATQNPEVQIAHLQIKPTWNDSKVLTNTVSLQASGSWPILVNLRQLHHW